MSIPLLANEDFATEALRMQGDVKRIGRVKSVFSELMKKDWLKDGQGFNWQSVTSLRSLPTHAVTWTPVQLNDGATNTCNPTPNPVQSSTLIQEWSAFQTAFRSEDICLMDGRFAFNSGEQILNRQKNFQDCIDDAWQEQDRVNYISSCLWKYVATDALDHTQGSTSFPLIPPTNFINQDLMMVFYNRLNRDNAQQDGGAITMRNGRPIFVAVMSSEMQQLIMRSDAGTREDIRFAEMGEGTAGATLTNAFGVDCHFGGFAHVCDDRMPRYDFVNGAWVERPFLAATGTSTLGPAAAEVSALYDNAEFEDIIFWHPAVVERHQLRPLGTLGAGTTYGPCDYVGDITWLNIQTEENPRNQVGYWRADLMAGYRPQLIQFGIVLRLSRCTNQLYSFSTCVR